MEYKNNNLYINNNNILDFLTQTPVHIYSKQYIISQFKIIQNNSNNLICYAVKANFNPEIIKIIISLGGGFDCVSQGEINHVINCGSDINKIIFSGVGKTEQELEFAIKTKIKQISCESIEEVDEIIEISRRLQIKANIALRTNLDIKTTTHKHISTGAKTDKFGIDYTKIISICDKIKTEKYINFIGLTTHIGSQILDINNFKIAFNQFEKVIEAVQDAGHKLECVSVGGGLGVIYKTNEREITQEYLQLIEDFKIKIKLPVILEPGRFLVANSCVTIARVIRIKKTDDINFLILNVGMNNIIRPALYGAYHHILPIIKYENPVMQNYKIVGPICESSDIFHENYRMQAMQKGDFVAILSTGAYCRSMASNYNLMPIADEIFI
jgi:diaminopimelate decarboxylase